MTQYSITDGVVYPIGRTDVSQQIFNNTDNVYDIAVAGQPFLLASTDRYPYQRQTAQYRKQQFDNTNEPGEQTFEGWWLRSQSSFHLGSGINYLDPITGENVQYRFFDSEGIDIWTPGQATLLRNVTQTHETTEPIAANGRTRQELRSIKFTGSGNTYSGCLFHDGYDLDKIYPIITASVSNKALTSNVATLTTSSAHGFAEGMEIEVSGVDSTFNGTYTIATVPSTTTFTYSKTASDVPSTAATGTVTSDVMHFVDYNTGSDDPVWGVCDDGTTAYWVTNDTASGKLEVNKKSLNAPGSTAPTVMFTDPGTTVTNAVMEFIKERIVMCVNNKVYEFPTSATSIPGTPVYTHPSTAHVFTSITASGTSIYVAGYNGIQSTIQRFTLSTAGVMPTLTSAIVAAELPAGEIVHSIKYYLSYMLIGTNLGIRVASVDDSGSLLYGPLIVETEQPVYAFATRDRFAWATTNVNGKPGVTRIDLSQQVEPLRFAYANDLFVPGVSGKVTTAVNFLNSLDRLAFCTNGSGWVYIEDEANLVENGYLETGFIRYGTIEQKHFKLIKPRIKTPMDGSISVSTKVISGDINSIITLTNATPALNTDLSTNINQPQEVLAFKFGFSRSSTDATKGPEFDGYQVKALPAVRRARQLTVPLLNFDFETDRYGNTIGFDGRAFERITNLETVEALGDTVLLQDFTTGETVLGVIEQLSFERTSPPRAGFSGFGGIIYISLRTV